MKIGTPESVNPAAATSTARTGESAAKPAAHKADGPAAAAGPDESAQVKLSSTATGLLDKTATSSSDFDADKVARIQQAMANGTFKVDAGAIADKLISNAQELLGKVSK